jgi:hypothetical protein
MPMAVDKLSKGSSREQVDRAISDTIAMLIREWRRTGKIGDSRPKTITEAQEQAAAIAYGIADKRMA